MNDEDLKSMIGELKVHRKYLNVPDDLRTECSALTPDTCRFYELAYRHMESLAADLTAASSRIAELESELSRAREALKPIAAAIRYNRYDGYAEKNWNPEAHADTLTITIKEARAVIAALSGEKPDASA